MKKLYVLFWFFVCAYYLGQANFENGYFIDDSGERTDCLIKNIDWASTPSQIEYKLTENSPVLTINFNEMKLFQILDSPHYYKKEVVSVDRNINKKQIEPKSETVVMKVLIDGSATLLTDFSIFYYQQNNSLVKQLVYKEYFEDPDFRKDNWFRTELSKTLTCGNNADRIKNLTYDKRNLEKFFINYNECAGTPYINYSNYNKTKVKFNVKALAGVEFYNTFSTNIDFVTGSTQKFIDHKFKPEPTIAVGAELEAILPFFNGNWSVILTPVYKSFKSTATDTYDEQFPTAYTQFTPSLGDVVKYHTHDITLKTEYRYSFLELPAGIRRYVYLNKNSKIFADASAGIMLNVGKKQEKFEFQEANPNPNKFHIDLGSNVYSFKKSPFIKIGAGYMFKDRYSVAANYYGSKKIHNSKGTSFSLMFAYNPF